MDKPEFRVERGPAATDEAFAIGMAKLLEREGRTIAAAELRRQHGEIKSMRAERLRSERRVEKLEAQRDALLEALKTYGWHTEDCPQYPTHARPKNWPACTCGFDAAIKAVEEGK